MVEKFLPFFCVEYFSSINNRLIINEIENPKFVNKG